MRKWRNPDTGEVRESEVSPGPGWQLDSGTASERKTTILTRADGSKALIDSTTGEVIKDYGGGETYADQSKFLGANGYTWQSGQGPSALWRSPSGQTVTEEIAVAQLQKSAMAPPPAPSTAGANNSFTANENALDRAARKDEFDRTQQANATTAQQAGIRWMVEEQARRDDINRQIAVADRLYEWTVTKDQFAMATDNKRLQLETQAQLFTQKTAILNLQAQRDAANANIDQFNANMQFQAAQATQQNENARQDRLAQTNRDVATFAAKPVDYGAAGAFSLANKGWGQQDAALAQGADLRTDKALEPLQGALDLRKIQSQPTAPVVAPQVQRMGPIDLSALQAPQSTVLPEGPVMTSAEQQAANVRMIEQPRLQAKADAIAWANTPKEIPQAAHGGVMDGAYISGERGPEINIPTPNGAIVLNQKQAKKMGIDLKALMKHPDMKKMWTGGVFGTSTPATNEARSFANTASAVARAGTPFQNGPLPTPVYASSPGTSSIVQQLLAGLMQQAQGYPVEEYLRQAQLLAPTGVGERVVGRSG